MTCTIVIFSTSAISEVELLEKYNIKTIRL